MQRLLHRIASSALFLAAGADSQDLHPQVRALLAPHGIARFPPVQRRALDTFVRVEEALAAGEHAACARLLDALWREHPPGSTDWIRTPAITADLNVGSPPCYYALRMLTDVVAWRRQRLAAPPSPAPLPLVLTVVLVGRSRGIEPRSMAELAQGGGTEVEHELDPLIRAGDARIVHASLALFADYLEAITAGRATLRTEILPLPDLVVKVQATAAPRRHAGLAGDALAGVWAALPASTRAATDWWWVLYPSHVPEHHPDFARTEFITGGMATGPDGASPCFLIDDRWLVRKPPHLGQGRYTDLERRAYLPQWLQHEFFHHLFRAYPEFGLEATGHQWFDRRTWPSDFEGRIEPDYYAEALHKRILPRGDPALPVKLRYAQAPPDVVARLQVADLEGTYQREPRANDWHTGRIVRAGDGETAGQLVLRWTNAAGVSWSLSFDRTSVDLATGPGNPYAHSRTFHLELARDASGRAEPRVIGFRFGGELYRRQAQ